MNELLRKEAASTPSGMKKYLFYICTCLLFVFLTNSLLFMYIGRLDKPVINYNRNLVKFLLYAYKIPRLNFGDKALVEIPLSNIVLNQQRSNFEQLISDATRSRQILEDFFNKNKATIGPVDAFDLLMEIYSIENRISAIVSKSENWMAYGTLANIEDILPHVNRERKIAFMIESLLHELIVKGNARKAIWLSEEINHQNLTNFEQHFSNYYLFLGGCANNLVLEKHSAEEALHFFRENLAGYRFISTTNWDGALIGGINRNSINIPECRNFLKSIDSLLK